MRGRGGALPSPWSPSLGLDPRCLPGTVGMNLAAYAVESPARWQVQNSKQRAVVRGPVDECPQGLALGERSGQRGKEKAHYTQIFNSFPFWGLDDFIYLLTESFIAIKNNM